MLKKFLLVVVVIVLALAVLVAFQPSEFRVTRSTTIAAPPAIVFAQVNDLHQWQGWSPWAKLDPAMQATYSGPPAGTGAAYAWEGNNKVGTGKMTILESTPDTLVRIKLEFLKPFAATDMSDFAFKPVSTGTEVTWSMTGHNNFMFKAFGLMMNMDKTIGHDFETGLAQLKQVAERAPRDSAVPPLAATPAKP